MRASTTEGNQSEERLKEYQRQQERLKAMATNTDKIKSMTADVMIENLLRQNFVKPNSAALDSKINNTFGLPSWLDNESTEVPGAYIHLWGLVRTPANFADTHKVSQLLLTSGLQMEVLGFIWNLSNKAVPGQLNKQEFYIVLALVALAQLGYSFNNLSILTMIPTAPIPSLQTKVLEKYVRSPSLSGISYLNETVQTRHCDDDVLKLSQSTTTKYNDDQSLFSVSVGSVMSSTNVNESAKDSTQIKINKKFSKLNNSTELFDSANNKEFSKSSNFPFIGSSPTAELEREDDDFSDFQTISVTETMEGVNIHAEDSSVSSQADEFTEFQCADINVDPLETFVISQKKEIPKIPLPRNLGGKLSNLRTGILKISPESERKLKVLKQPETLSSLPESKISINNKVSTMPNISVLGGSRDIGMRLANHSLGSKPEKTKHQRYYKHKSPVQVDDIHNPPKFGAIDELFPKCFQKSCTSSKTFVLKETKIGNVEAVEQECSVKCETGSTVDMVTSGKNTRKIEIPMLGTFNETTLPTQSETAQLHSVELFSVEEDKYSALREVELEMKSKKSEMKTIDDTVNANVGDGTDDFGEFLSVDIPSSTQEDLWGEWSNTDPVLLPSTDVHDGKLNNIQRPCEDLKSVEEEELSHQLRSNDSNNSALNFDLLSLSDGDDTKATGVLPQFSVEMTTYDHQERRNEEPSKSMNECLHLNVGKIEENKTENFNDFILLESFKAEKSQYSNACHLGTSTTDEFDVNNSSENFGIFFTTDLNHSATEAINRDDPVLSLDGSVFPLEAKEQEIMRKKCLIACLNLMQQGIEIFNGVTSTSVLEEVFSTQEAIIYLNNLNVVSQISRRVSANFSDLSYIQEDIDKIWQKLINYCREYNITLREDADSNTAVGKPCHVCLGFVGSDGIEQGPSSYHLSCANLWINCIDSELPCPI